NRRPLCAADSRAHCAENAHSSAATRRSRTAHDLYSAKICYRYHPRYGVRVELVRYLRSGSAAVVIVRLPDGLQLAVPEWMLRPEACELLRTEAKPCISAGALLELQGLINAQSSTLGCRNTGCAESATGGQDAQQRGSGQT